MSTSNRLASSSRLVLGAAQRTQTTASSSLRCAYASRASRPSNQDWQDAMAEDQASIKRGATRGKTAQSRATPPTPTSSRPAVTPEPDASRADPMQHINDEYHGTSEGGKDSPATSMWTAPQSLLNPSVPRRRKPFDDKRADVYFRRVAQPDKFTGPPPAMWQRYATIGAGFMSAAITVYFLYFAEFGEREHVFSGIRRALRDDAVNPFGVSAEERQWIEKKKADHAAARAIAE